MTNLPSYRVAGFLKTGRLSANSGLVSAQIDSYHIKPVQEFMAQGEDTR